MRPRLPVRFSSPEKTADTRVSWDTAGLARGGLAVLSLACRKHILSFSRNEYFIGPGKSIVSYSKCGLADAPLRWS